MTDPRASTALLHLPLGGPPLPRWVWAVAVPDRSGRIQLPVVAVDLLGRGPAHAQVVGGVLVLGHDPGGRTIGVDHRGRCYLPVWLRRPAVVIATDPTARAVLVADAAVLDPVGDELPRALRPHRCRGARRRRAI